MRLSLFYPSNPYYVTQKFGETAYLEYYKANGVIFKGHNGTDIVANHGDPIRAAHDGEAWYEVDASQGHGVVIRTSEKYDYENGECYFKSLYWHLINGDKEPTYRSPVDKYRDINKPGMQVKAGDIIGYADSTGLSTGTHLHFGLKPVAQNEVNGGYYNADQANGYNGAVDPAPYFNGRYAEDARQYIFNVDMSRGSEGEEVVQLQKKLRRLGYFTYPTNTGYYGESTREAVYRFQLENIKNLGWLAKNIFRGLYCYKLTREALNKKL